MRILVTGSEGLIGRSLCRCIKSAGHDYVPYDIVFPVGHSFRGDIRDVYQLSRALMNVDGVVHLAAVSRVKHAEADPATCHVTNVEGTRSVLSAAASVCNRPWVLVASSREVYGNPNRVPVLEEDTVNPINTYGQSKALCEALTLKARTMGSRVGIIRLANVYGHTSDHADRVVPAFCRAAAMRTPMRVEGRGYTFDFTHVDDVAQGLLRYAELLQDGNSNLPIIHLASGRPTTLEALAEMASAAGGHHSFIEYTNNYTYNVASFIGDPTRAANLLGWRASTSIECGVARLVRDFHRFANNPAA